MRLNKDSEQKLTAESEEVPVNGRDNDDDRMEQGSVLKRKRIWIPFLLILIAGAAFWLWYRGQIGFVSTDDAYIDGNRLSLASKMLGRITVLYADEGNNVTAGQLLVRLDSTDLIAQRDQALISLKLAKDDIQLAQVNLDKAQQDFERAKQQYQGKIIPTEQYEHSQNTLNAAQAEYKIAQTKVGSADAQLNVINTQLNNTTIYSPMNGVVAKRWAFRGDVVQPGQPIFTIYDLDSLWVTADLQETDLLAIRQGQNVQINVDSYPDRNFEGNVLQIGTNTASQFALIPPSNASGNFTKVTQRIPIKISIRQSNDPENKHVGPVLLPGMSVEIKIKVN
ncbi:MAG TPA: HlyD family secretion protein [Ignavibacteriaceae bacterium]